MMGPWEQKLSLSCFVSTQQPPDEARLITPAAHTRPPILLPMGAEKNAGNGPDQPTDGCSTSLLMGGPHTCRTPCQQDWQP